MRKTITELRQEFLKSFEDPSTSGINEGKLFDFLANMLDTYTPAYGVLATPGPFARSLTTVNAVLPWQAEYLAQLPEYSTNPATGAITRNEAITSNRIYVNVDVELATNREVELTLFANGLATPWRTKAIGSGSGRPSVASFEAINYSAVPVTYQIQALVDTATTVTFSNGVFVVTAVPVREA
jgi:hypothetical protein